MTSPEYSSVRSVFHEVFGLEPAEQNEALERLCAGDDALRAEVERLLSAHDLSGDQLEPGDPSILLGGIAPDVEGHRIVGVLGEGGMGVVYKAEQEHPRRTVALKVIRPGLISPAVTRRFQREAEVLGRLNHPGIAQVYSIGLGRIAGREMPYIAMEYVEGVPVTDHAEDRRLDTEQRLGLVCEVCDAIAHAHARGVVHRDLKPANILVTPEGRAKVLDFGIARITSREARVTTLQTEAGRILGTASYMSPEQALGDPALIDERSDVYALGVLLFEMLSGRLPHDVSTLALPDAIRVIREDDATRLATVDTRLRGDVDIIVARALERDPERRYQSVAGFADDVRRHLSDQPILARAPTTLYQIKKYVRRNRALVAGALGVVVALVAGLVGVSVALSRESDARARAEQSLVRAEAAVGFLEQILLGISPDEARGRDTELIRAMLSRAQQSLDGADVPEVVRAEMYLITGEALHSIFEFDDARAPLEAASELFGRLGPEYRPSAVDARLKLADTVIQLGDNDAGVEILNAIIASDSGAVRTDQVVDAQRQLAEIRMDQGDLEAAIALLDGAERLIEPEDRRVRGSVQMLRGATLRRMGRLDEAKAAYRTALALFERIGDRSHAAKIYNSLAIVARTEGRIDEAEGLYRSSIDARMGVDGRANPDVASVLSNLGRLLADADRLEEAKEVLERSVEMHAEVFGQRHFTLGFPMRSLGQVRSKLDDHEGARAMLDDALARMRGHFGDSHAFVATVLIERADASQRAGRYSDAIGDYESVIAMASRTELSPSAYIFPAQRGIGDALMAQGKIDQARDAYRSAIESGASPSEIEAIRERMGREP